MKLVPTLFLILFLFSQNSVQAQSSIEEIPCNKQSSNKGCDTGWLTIGIGGDKNFDFSGVLAANFGRDYFWELKLYTATNLCLSSCPDAPGFTSISVSKGYSLVDRVGRIAFSFGPSIISGKEKFDNERFYTFGLITDIQFMITPFKDFGLGLDLFGNINSKLSTYGITLTLVIEGHK